MPILGVVASSIRTGLPATYELITSQLLSSNTQTVTFNSISQAYSDLVIRGSIRTTQNAGFWDDIKINFNGDTNANYIGRLRWATGTSDNQQSESATYAVLRPHRSPTASPNTDLYSNWEFYITNYSSTSMYKGLHGIDGTEYFNISAESGLFNNGYVYINTSAISSISLVQFSTPPAGDISAQSLISIYGIKRA
jgi:hypothetical protein